MTYKETYVSRELINLIELRLAKSKGYNIEERSKEVLQIEAGRRLLGSDAELHVHWHKRYLDRDEQECNEESRAVYYKEISLRVTVIKGI